MIAVRVTLGDGVTRIEVTGHGRETAADPIDGSLVCAAVTAITQTALLGLQAYAGAHPDLVSFALTEEYPACPS